jgi:uncharacterized protein (TIGR03382 family)
MKKLLLASACVFALASGAKADIILETKLSGTGDNVVLNAVTGDLALAQLNGQHQEFVRFRDLTGSTTFTAQSTGNDIKIEGSNNIFIQVFDFANLNVVGTTTEVFSLNGTGEAQAFVQAVDQFGNVEPIQFFSLGTLSLTQPSNFTLSAINGEVMTSVRITSLGAGTISSFEHFRIDVAPVPFAVPGPAVGAGLPGLMAFGLLAFSWLRRRRFA